MFRKYTVIYYVPENHEYKHLHVTTKDLEEWIDGNMAHEECVLFVFEGHCKPIEDEDENGSGDAVLS